MTNAPDRYERFVVPEGVDKITVEKDTKVANAAKFTLQREDHTIGNILRMQLHRDEHVLFAGYQIPHPLEHRLIVKVQTNGRKTPVAAVEDALTALTDEYADIQEQFREQVAAKSAGNFTVY